LHDHAAGGGFDAVGVLQVAGEVDGLLEGETDDLVAEFLDVLCNFSHDEPTFSASRVVARTRVEHVFRHPRADLTLRSFNPRSGAVGMSESAFCFRSTSFCFAAVFPHWQAVDRSHGASPGKDSC